MHLSQLKQGGVIYREDEIARLVRGVDSTYCLAKAAIEQGESLLATIERHGLGEQVDLPALAAQGLLDCPIRHPDPAHMFITGTGLTHLGSAATRDAMHASTATEEENISDSMKMFRMGIKEGKPAAGEIGVQPEWFYKGTGASVVAPESALLSPDFALDGGEEPEIAGVYLLADDGTPYRLGFALANEFSDHVTERINYLFLAHSKLRQCSFGPELLVGELPQHIEGYSRIMRDGVVQWEKPFLSGERNMSHSIRNLEHHHFKYDLFRQAGDLHVHLFGTATLSFADGVKVEQGEVFEIAAPAFGLPLRNPLGQSQSRATDVKVL